MLLCAGLVESNYHVLLYCRFGTFLCNCDKERHDLVMYARTISLWAHIEAEREKFLNPDYCVSIEVCVCVSVVDV